jgi:hypothetical protein
MESGVRRVVSGIGERIVEGLLNSKEKKLRNFGVSKQRSHDSIATFPRIILKNIQFFSHNSRELGRAMFEAFMLQSEQGQRRDRASA